MGVDALELICQEPPDPPNCITGRLFFDILLFGRYFAYSYPFLPHFKALLTVTLLTSISIQPIFAPTMVSLREASQAEGRSSRHERGAPL